MLTCSYISTNYQNNPTALGCTCNCLDDVSERQADLKLDDAKFYMLLLPGDVAIYQSCL